jgi:hypothetical protein
MGKVPKAVSAYMAGLGSKGGKAKGPAKARDPELYKRLADMKKAAAAKRLKGDK